MSHGPAQAIVPEEGRRRRAWRVACVTYRQCRREGHDEDICFHNARHALWLLMPDLAYWDAAEETTQAISYASCAHPKWLWSGTSGNRRPKMPFVPPHVIRDPVTLFRMAKEERAKRTGAG